MKKVYLTEQLYYDVYENGKRTIYSPCKQLKDIQKVILNLIRINYNIRLNTKEAALVHTNQKWLLKLDIKDFYNSISKELIVQAINKIYGSFSFAQDIKKDFIYKICTLDNKLPTGAVTSAHLANIAFDLTQIDEKLLDYCKQEGINYSRYMDDIFFSCNSKEKLNKVEKLTTNLLKEAGFSANSEKTKYISNNKRQEVLGLAVNNSAVVPIESKRKYRAVFFNYLKAVYLEERLGVGSLFLKKVGYKEVCGYLAYIKNTDYKFYTLMQKFIISKINKFGINENKEIKKLKKVVQK